MEGRSSSKDILEIRNLTIGIRQGKNLFSAVDDVSYSVRTGEILGIVGESGCGKTVTNLAIMGLLPDALAIKSGQILFEGTDLAALSDKEREKIDGSRISMIYQEPLTSLNPLIKIGKQVGEPLKIHEKLSKDEIQSRVLESLTDVGLPDPRGIMDLYPHQLSGGMRQRVMIAMATICRPRLMIADEPTTALDVTVQAKILRLLKHISARYGMSIIFISHDLAVIRQICDRVLVMYAGKTVELAETDTIMNNPLHPYTKGLLRSIPTQESKGKVLPAIPGHVPSTTEKKDPCPFAPRCPLAGPSCKETVPAAFVAGDEHLVWCHYVGKGTK